MSNRVRGLALAIVVLGSLVWPVGSAAQAQVRALTTAQRQAYLAYYAPVILKRGDENDGREGSDWLSNYDFDRDGDFSDNRVNWRDGQPVRDGGRQPALADPADALHRTDRVHGRTA